jgi:hypothetical protein
LIAREYGDQRYKKDEGPEDFKAEIGVEVDQFWMQINK